MVSSHPGNVISLQTTRLRLREFEPRDLATVLELHRLLAQFIPSAITPDEAAAKRHLQRFMSGHEDPRHGYWLVERRDRGGTAEPVGIILVKPIPPSGGAAPSETEIGWRVMERHGGNGYMSEAARAVITALFAAGLDEVVAVTHPDNVASQAVAKRAGMREIGLSTAYYDTQTLLFRASSSDVAR